MSDGALWNQRANTRVLVYLNGVATDITAYVSFAAGGLNANRGRQTELAQMDPSRMSFTLINQDGRFTPGNPSSPYYPHWRQGARIVWLETVGARTFSHFDGYLEIPEVQLNYETADGRNDRVLRAAAVDSLTRADRYRPFVSTLSAYVAANGGTALKAYWPLADASGSLVAAERSGNSVGPLVRELQYLLPQPDDGSVTLWDPGSQAGPRGDDASYLRLSPLLAGANPAVVPRMANRNITNVDCAANAMVGLSLWVYATGSGGQLVVLRDNFVANTLQIGYSASAWSLTAANAAGSTVLTISTVKLNAWSYVSARLNNLTGAVDFWVDDLTTSGTTGGASSGNMVSVVVDGRAASVAVGQLQIYNGALADYTNTTHVAQFDAGFSGLERQLTGDRIRTVAAYAGFPTSALDHVDNGTTAMGIAALAGKTPRQAWQEAADAERGRLFSAGDGSIVFHDRHRIYDI